MTVKVEAMYIVLNYRTSVRCFFFFKNKDSVGFFF